MSDGRTEGKIQSLLDNGYVKLSSLIAALLFCAGTVYQGAEFLKADALWKQATQIKLDNRLAAAEKEGIAYEKLILQINDIEKQLVAMNQISYDRLRKSEMREWIERTREKNADWHPATIP